MTPAHKSAIASRGSELDLDLELPYDLKEHMNTMFAIGYSLLPLGKGPDGKEPTMEFDGRPRFPLQVVGKRMALIGASMYGVRCDGLVVVDIDNMDPATLAYADRCFGPSPYVVRTQDGEHRYYRADTAQKFRTTIRKSQVKIDLKHGANSYVAGPGSVRHDNGFVYTMVGEPLPPIHVLPVFRDRDMQPRQNAQADKSALGSKPRAVMLPAFGCVANGNRNSYLTKKAVELVLSCDNEGQLFDDLLSHAKTAFKDMADFPDTEIQKITKWGWNLRLSDRLYRGRKSAPRIERHEYIALDQIKNGADAQRLLAELRHNHASQPGKRFAISSHAMAKAKIISGWSESRYRRARIALIQVGLVRQVKKGSQFNGAGQYQLVRLPINSGE